MGFTASSAYGVLGGLLSSAREHLPHVEFVLRELVTRDQMDRISSGALDLGLARPPTRPELTSRLLRCEPLVAAVPEGHPLAEQPTPLELDAFHGADVVTYSPSEARYFHDLLVGLFQTAGVRPTYVQHVSQVHTVLALVEVGLGIGLVPATAAKLGVDNVVLRPAALPEPNPVELHLVWRQDNDNPALHSLLDLVG